MASKRQPFLWAYIGHTGTGKTSTAVLMAKEWKKKYKGQKVIGFDPHDILRKEKLLDYYISAKDKNWAETLVTQLCVTCKRVKHPEKDLCAKCGKANFIYKFANSLLILDDYRALLQLDRTDEDVMNLLMLRRRIGIDMIYICHNPKFILNGFAPFTTHYSIFYSESHSTNFSDKIPKYKDCQKAANLANQYVMKFGRGTYPNFPYALVQPESDGIETINMNEENIKTLKELGLI